MTVLMLFCSYGISAGKVLCCSYISVLSGTSEETLMTWNALQTYVLVLLLIFIQLKFWNPHVTVTWYQLIYLLKRESMYQSNIGEAYALYLPCHKSPPVFPCVHSNIHTAKLFIIITPIIYLISALGIFYIFWNPQKYPHI